MVAASQDAPGERRTTDARSTRALDLVLLGATGFTGGLVARYLAQRTQGSPLRWGLAGRDLDKLRVVRDALPDGARVELVRADLSDPASLQALTSRARVVATTAGPFESRGEALVAACVEHGCDYVDITGELPFWARTVARYHAAATARGVLVVPCCGFESIPIDLGVRFTAHRVRGDGPLLVRGYVTFRGKVSGGTWASALLALSRGKQWQDHAGELGPTGRPHFVRALGRWALPVPTVDRGVVARTCRLAHDPALADLRYEHYLMTRNLVGMGRWVAGMGAVAVLAQSRRARQWLADRLPQGTGPSEEDRRRSSFEVDFVARRGAEVVARTRVSGHDPGYDHTSKMLAESALVLVEERDALPWRGGVLTPALALGDPLQRRLEATGMHFTEL